MKKSFIFYSLLLSQAFANPSNKLIQDPGVPRFKQLLQKFENVAVNLKPQVQALQPKPVVPQGGIKPQVQALQPKPVVPQGGIKPQVQVLQPKPVVPQGGIKPQAQAIQPKPVAPQGGIKPQAQAIQPKPVAPQGGVKPQQRPLPVVPQGGIKPQIQAPQPKPVVPQGGIKPQVQAPQPKPVMPQGGIKPQVQAPQPKPMVPQGGVKLLAQQFQAKPGLIQGGIKPQVQAPQPKPVAPQGGVKPQVQALQPKPVAPQGGVKPQVQALQPKPVAPQGGVKPQVQAPQQKHVVGKLIQNLQQQKPLVVQPKLPVGKLAQNQLANIPVHALGMGKPQNLLPKKKLMDFNNPEAYRTIHKINFTHNTPNTTDIRHLLINAGLAKDTILGDTSTIVADILGQGGYYTKFLYKIKLPAHIAADNQEKKLIIKGIHNHAEPDHEANNLIYLRQQKEVFDLNQSTNPHTPKLGIDVLNYSYTANYGKEECIAIMKKISGKSIKSYLTDPRDERYPMFENVGRALGELHYRLAYPQEQNQLNAQNFDYYQTINHRDFHTGNILYNKKNKQVAFIDLERMADAHKERSPFWHDIHQMYQSIGYSNNMIFFLNGYVQAYPLGVQINLRNYLYNRFSL